MQENQEKSDAVTLDDAEAIRQIKQVLGRGLPPLATVLCVALIVYPSHFQQQ